MGDQVARISSAFQSFLDQTPLDLLLLLGDRYELLSFANVAVLNGVKLAHISGGEVTEGAIDDKIRHALTKLSDIHFVGTDEFKKRVIQLGEQPSRVHVVGELGLEHLHHRVPCSLFDQLQCNWLDQTKPFILFTYHPETSGEAVDPLRQQTIVLEAMESCLEEFNLLITYPNSDKAFTLLIRQLNQFASKHRDCVFLEESLGFRRYGQALSDALMVVGNSSSGLYEAPSYQAVTVNIGDRQKGRLRGNTVIDTPCQKEAIINAIQSAKHLASEVTEWYNPYGDGHSSEKILGVLRRELPSLSTVKPFFDLS
jgi:UDP-hydrolysing UDP-N-acetyl-D-glucosamine 2-epimerase